MQLLPKSLKDNKEDIDLDSAAEAVNCALSLSAAETVNCALSLSVAETVQAVNCALFAGQLDYAMIADSQNDS